MKIYAGSGLYKINVDDREGLGWFLERQNGETIPITTTVNIKRWAKTKEGAMQQAAKKACKKKTTDLQKSTRTSLRKLRELLQISIDDMAHRLYEKKSAIEQFENGEVRRSQFIDAYLQMFVEKCEEMQQQKTAEK